MIARPGATARLWIEPLALVHAEALRAAFDDPRGLALLPLDEVASVDAMRARIEVLTGPPPGVYRAWLNWAVRVSGPTGAVIGRVEAAVADGWAEIAYVIGAAHWGHGYATEAVGWMLDALAAGGVDECWACTSTANTPSSRVVERLGFVPAPTPPARPLGSYEPGDRVFVRRRS